MVLGLYSCFNIDWLILPNVSNRIDDHRIEKLISFTVSNLSFLAVFNVTHLAMHRPVQYLALGGWAKDKLKQ